MRRGDRGQWRRGSPRGRRGRSCPRPHARCGAADATRTRARAGRQRFLAPQRRARARKGVLMGATSGRNAVRSPKFTPARAFFRWGLLWLFRRAFPIVWRVKCELIATLKKLMRRITRRSPMWLVAGRGARAARTWASARACVRACALIVASVQLRVIARRRESQRERSGLARVSSSCYCATEVRILLLRVPACSTRPSSGSRVQARRVPGPG